MQHPARLVLCRDHVSLAGPRGAEDLFVLGLESCKFTLAFEVDLEIGESDVRAVAKPVEQCPVDGQHDRLAFVERIWGGIQIEKNSLGGCKLVDRVEKRERLAQIIEPEEPFANCGAVDRRVRQQIAEHLGKRRLARAEESADPDVDLFARVSDRLLELLERPDKFGLDVIGRDVLLDLFEHRLLVIDLDDFLDVAIDLAAENVVDLHHLLSREMISAR